MGLLIFFVFFFFLNDLVFWYSSRGKIVMWFWGMVLLNSEKSKCLSALTREEYQRRGEQERDFGNHVFGHSCNGTK